MSIKVKLLAVSALIANTGLTWGQQPPATGVEARGAPQAPNGAARAGRGGAGFVSAPTFDKEPPLLPANLKPGGVLIFSKTNGFRDEASIQASNAALAAIAHERGWPFFITENGAVMNKDQFGKVQGGRVEQHQRRYADGGSASGFQELDGKRWIFLWALTAPAAIP